MDLGLDRLHSAISPPFAIEVGGNLATDFWKLSETRGMRCSTQLILEFTTIERSFVLVVRIRLRRRW